MSLSSGHQGCKDICGPARGVARVTARGRGNSEVAKIGMLVA